MAQAFLDGFTGGVFSTGRPSAPTSFFPEDSDDEAESAADCDGESGRAGLTENLEMSDLDHDHPTTFSHPA
jgi:hypothetical protein